MATRASSRTAPSSAARDIVVAWGGDGTVNEVASALAFTDAALGVIPGGFGQWPGTDAGDAGRSVARPAATRSRPRSADRSGRGKRPDLRQRRRRRVRRACRRTALPGSGARDADFCATGPLCSRSSGAIARSPMRSSSTREPSECDSAFLLSFANGRQWGNGAVIAPHARLDDGLLDAVARQGAESAGGPEGIAAALHRHHRSRARRDDSAASRSPASWPIGRWRCTSTGRRSTAATPWISASIRGACGYGHKAKGERSFEILTIREGGGEGSGGL